MRELEQYQKTEAYKVFSRKAQDRQKGKSHRQGIDRDKNVLLARRFPVGHVARHLLKACQ